MEEHKINILNNKGVFQCKLSQIRGNGWDFTSKGVIGWHFIKIWVIGHSSVKKVGIDRNMTHANIGSTLIPQVCWFNFKVVPPISKEWLWAYATETMVPITACIWCENLLLPRDQTNLFQWSFFNAWLQRRYRDLPTMHYFPWNILRRLSRGSLVTKST